VGSHARAIHTDSFESEVKLHWLTGNFDPRYKSNTPKGAPRANAQQPSLEQRETLDAQTESGHNLRKKVDAPAAVAQNVSSAQNASRGAGAPVLPNLTDPVTQKKVTLVDGGDLDIDSTIIQTDRAFGNCLLRTEDTEMHAAFFGGFMRDKARSYVDVFIANLLLPWWFEALYYGESVLLDYSITGMAYLNLGLCLWFVMNHAQEGSFGCNMRWVIGDKIFIDRHEVRPLWFYATRFIPAYEQLRYSYSKDSAKTFGVMEEDSRIPSPRVLSERRAAGSMGSFIRSAKLSAAAHQLETANTNRFWKQRRNETTRRKQEYNSAMDDKVAKVQSDSEAKRIKIQHEMLDLERRMKGIPAQVKRERAKLKRKRNAQVTYYDQTLETAQNKSAC
jgi:hypothetical protein